MKIFVLVFCISLQILSISTKILPKNFPVFCSKSDPNYNECMENGLRKMGPYFLKGIKSIDFPNLHPLQISTFSIDRQLFGDVSVKAELKNLQFYGYNNMELRNFEFDPTSLKGRVVLYIPVLEFKDDYDATGRFGTFKLASAGHGTGNATDLDLEFNFKFKKINKVGIDYLTIDKFEVKGDIQNIHLKVVSRDPEQQTFTNLAVEIFNARFKEIMQLGNSIYNESLAAYYETLVEKFLSGVPANEILPE